MQQPFSPLPSIAPQLPKMGPSTPRPPYLLPYIEGFRPKRYKAPGYFTDYNDPYELNSIADVILTSFNPDMKRGNWGGIEKVPILNMFTGAADMFNQTTLQPALHGDWKAVGINNLFNLSETLDIVANPVKGLMIEGPSGFTKALGFGSAGRVNYDHDTGAFASDVFAELFSDPLNWITFFGKGAVSLTVKSAVKGSLKSEVGIAGKQLAQEVGDKAVNKYYKHLTNRAVTAYLNGDHKTMTESLTRVAENMQRTGKLQFNKTPSTADFLQAVTNAIDSTKDTMSAMTILNLRKLINPVESFELGLLKTGLTSSGIYPAWWLIGKGKNVLSKYFLNKNFSVLRPFLKFDGSISFSDYTAAQQSWTAQIDNMGATLRLFNESGMSPEAFQVMMHQSATADQMYIVKAFNELWNTPDKLAGALNTFFKEKHGVDSFEEYVAVVREVNEQTDNTFLDFEDIKLVQRAPETQYTIEQLVAQKAIQNYRQAQADNKRIEDILKTKTYHLNDYVVDVNFGVGKIVGWDEEHDYYRVRFNDWMKFVGKEEEILMPYEWDDVPKGLADYDPSVVNYVWGFYLDDTEAEDTEA